MHLALWIVQTVLALLFLAAGAMKLTKSKDDLRADMAWVCLLYTSPSPRDA